MENKLNLGELDTRVIVQECYITTGPEGEKVMQYVPFSRPFAKIERIASEAVSHDNLEEGQRLSLTMYKIPEMTTRWRIVIDEVPYEITAIDSISRVSPLCLLSVSAIDR